MTSCTEVFQTGLGWLWDQVEVNDVPSDTKDKDEIMESEFFDTRQSFLSLCQGNHYQYDTLRRAKHSSMMMLYHLHNPTAPAFVASCNFCHLDIESGWRCETCADYDLCNKCKDTANHPHKLAPFYDRTAQNKEARRKRVLQVYTNIYVISLCFDFVGRRSLLFLRLTAVINELEVLKLALLLSSYGLFENDDEEHG